MVWYTMCIRIVYAYACMGELQWDIWCVCVCVCVCVLEEDDEQLDSQRRRANSLTSLADSNCCYGNLLWQQGTQSSQVYNITLTMTELEFWSFFQPLVREGEGVVDQEGTTMDGTNEPLSNYYFFHKRSSSCSSAESIEKVTGTIFNMCPDYMGRNMG